MAHKYLPYYKEMNYGRNIQKARLGQLCYLVSDSTFDCRKYYVCMRTLCRRYYLTTLCAFDWHFLRIQTILTAFRVSQDFDISKQNVKRGRGPHHVKKGEKMHIYTDVVVDIKVQTLLFCTNNPDHSTYLRRLTIGRLLFNIVTRKQWFQTKMSAGILTI